VSKNSVIVTEKLLSGCVKKVGVKLVGKDTDKGERFT
jgi:hypothetical protein